MNSLTEANKDLKFLNLLFNYSHTSFWILNENTDIIKSFSYGKITNNLNFKDRIFNELFKGDSFKPRIYTFNSIEAYSCIKFIKDNDVFFLIIGPSIISKSLDKHLHRFLSFYNESSLHSIEDILALLPTTTYLKFASLLCLIFTTLTGMDITMEEILEANINISTTELVSDFEQAIFLMREETKKHKSYEQELLFLKGIENGDVNNIMSLMRLSVAGDVGLLSKNPLKQSIYEFIATVTLVTRFAIQGGLDSEIAYNLSDIYIQKVDTCTSNIEVKYLAQSMAKDFAFKVKEHKRNSKYSRPITLCLDYIFCHLHYPISRDELAELVDFNPAYLSCIFKKEVGTSLSEYIQIKRVEEAKNLLRFSKYTYFEISNYLCFSSQSYFNNIFKKHVGVTPKEYRSKLFRSNIDNLKK